jgi:uncharacterized protein (TIGR02246 family)
MKTENDTAIAEAEIRKLTEDRINAVRNKDVDAAMSSFALDVLSFDVVNPLQHVGSGSIRKRLTDWFSSFQGPIGYEVRDLSITSGGDVAFSHSLHGVNATTGDGAAINMWFRVTICYRNIQDTWMITHEHSSVPFDPETGRASLDLKPA